MVDFYNMCNKTLFEFLFDLLIFKADDMPGVKILTNFQLNHWLLSTQKSNTNIYLIYNQTNYNTKTLLPVAVGMLCMCVHVCPSTSMYL